ncbi:uncharacterized protein [Clytia hemisphaerica]|uniref:uncharacterized protein n=1 Tax=Clytia hemisphaerica TaxID=252671 RepID=UPI0034D49208
MGQHYEPIVDIKFKETSQRLSRTHGLSLQELQLLREQQAQVWLEKHSISSGQFPSNVSTDSQKKRDVTVSCSSNYKKRKIETGDDDDEMIPLVDPIINAYDETLLESVEEIDKDVASKFPTLKNLVVQIDDSEEEECTKANVTFQRCSGSKSDSCFVRLAPSEGISKEKYYSFQKR